MMLRDVMKAKSVLIVICLIGLLTVFGCGGGGGDGGDIQSDIPAKTPAEVSTMVKQATVCIRVSQVTRWYPENEEAKQFISSGSGFFISEDGYVLTNAHVVNGNGIYRVYLKDANSKWIQEGGDIKAFGATLIGVDECADLALLKVNLDGQDIKALSFYKADPYEGMSINVAGYPSIAMSNWDINTQSYFYSSGSILSVEENILPGISWAMPYGLTFDAISSSGSSGGPIVEECGEVLGVNFASDSSTGLQFAITGARNENLEDIIERLKQLEGTGVNTLPDSIGVRGKFYDAGNVKGIWVISVLPGSPAYKTGIVPGDSIISLGGSSISSIKDYFDILRQYSPGTGNNPLAIEILTSYGKEKDGELNNPEKTISHDDQDDQPTIISGSLSNEDLKFNDNSYYDRYMATASADGTVSISLLSGDYDVYLEAKEVNPDGTVGANIDYVSNAAGTSASLAFTVNKDDKYYIMAGSDSPSQFGNYTLTISNILTDIIQK